VGRSLLDGRDVRAALADAAEEASGPWPDMSYRKLGKTEFMGSRLVFGCGAALSSSPRDDLLDRAFDAGVNVFDVGTSRYYRDAEKNLASFLRRRRDQILLISKASPYIDIDPNEIVSVSQAREGARTWSKLLDESLGELGVERVDAYYVMAANNPSIIRAEEMHEAFLAAKRAGKVKHWGLSTHENAQRVLEAAIQTGWYSLAQIAITPAGWYSWADKKVLPDSPAMTQLQPLFERARKAGIGMIGMKAGRFIAGRKWFGWGNPGAFDGHYSAGLLAADLSPFQRSYAYVLEHGLDAVNADMQELSHLAENFRAAAMSAELVA
jgi:aryl-alcohol dehydrogenase-like predicted oxidoreductase